MLNAVNEDGKILPDDFYEVLRVEGDFIYGRFVRLSTQDTRRFALFLDEFHRNAIIYDKECLLKNLINRSPEKLESQVRFESSKMRSDVWKVISENL